MVIAMTIMISVILAVISTVLILVGLAGIILPFLPGVLIAWLGLFIFAIGTRFERISIATIVIFFIVTLLTFAFDLFVPLLVARKSQVSKWGFLGGSFGSFLGTATLGSRGIIIGPFLGTILGELINGTKHGRVLKIALGILIGIIAGTLLKIIVILTMLGFLIASWF